MNVHTQPLLREQEDKSKRRLTVSGMWSARATELLSMGMRRLGPTPSGTPIFALGVRNSSHSPRKPKPHHCDLQHYFTVPSATRKNCIQTALAKIPTAISLRETETEIIFGRPYSGPSSRTVIVDSG